MGIFSKFEGKVDDAFDGMAGAVFKSPIEPTQIAKKCEKEMHRNKLVGKGTQYAPTLYTVLVNSDDDKRLFGFYPTMAGELETYLVGAADDAGYTIECRPLVRFIADEGLKSGKFAVIAEVVTSSIVAELREEEAEYYGLDNFAKGNRQRIESPNPNKRPGGTRRRANEASAKPQDAPYQRQRARMEQRELAGLDQNTDFSGLDNIGESTPDEFGAAAAAAGAAMAAGAGVGAASSRAHQNQQSQLDEYGYDEHGDSYAPNKYDDYSDMTGFASAASSEQHARGYGYPAAVLVNNRSGQTFDLNMDSTLIGRENYCDICIPDASVSREHARIQMDNMGAWSVEDLGSTNGTKVNGRPAQKQVIKFGDQLTFGTTVMIFQKG